MKTAMRGTVWEYEATGCGLYLKPTRISMRSVCLTQVGSLKTNAGHNFLHGRCSLLCGVGDLCQVLRWIEVAEMLDTIISLAVCSALLVYLVYAMLRPEKF